MESLCQRSLSRRSRGIFYRKRLKNTPSVLYTERFLHKSVLHTIHFFRKSVLASEVPMLVDTAKLSTLLGISRTTHLAYLEYLDEAKEGKQVAAVKNAYIVADDIEYSYGNKLPIWLFGLLY